MRYKKGDYFIVPNKSVLNELDSYSQIIFVWICARADENGMCFPSYSNLAKTCNISRPTVIDRIVALENAGFIRKIKGNYKKSNRYQIMLIGSKGDLPPSKRDLPEVVNQIDSNNNQLTISNNNSVNSKELNKQIGEIINCFEPLNHNYKRWFAMPPQRRAVKELIDKLGFEKLKALVEHLPEIVAMPYSPSIATPHELNVKLTKLIAFFKKEENIKSKKVKEFII